MKKESISGYFQRILSCFLTAEEIPEVVRHSKYVLLILLTFNEPFPSHPYKGTS